MKKEIIIISIIIISIIGLNFITQKYTKDTVNLLSMKLEELKEKCIEEDEEKIIYTKDDIKGIWEDRKQKLAYYIEHDELEKVETRLSLIMGNIETKKFDEAIPNIEDTIFILKHIQEKYICVMQNVF